MPAFSELDGSFVCPHRMGCPYLEGLPTPMVWDRVQEAIGLECHYEHTVAQLQEELDQARRRDRQREQEIQELKAQLQALRRRQFKGRRTARPLRTAAAHDGLKKKRGAPPGHPHWQRPKPATVDQVVLVPAPTTCPDCQQTGLQPLDSIHEHLQEDIVLAPRTVTTCYRHQQAYCPNCECAVHQAGPGEMPGSYIGPAAKATAVYLRQELRVSYRNISRFFADLFGLKFVPASAYGFDRQAARRGAPLHADLLEKVRSLPVLHADETSWRHEGQNHWVWFAGNQDLAAFLWHPRRTTEAAQELLGPELNSILVADAYASYNGVKVKDRPSCLAHLKRTAQDLDAELALLQGRAQDPPARRMCQDVQALVKEACQITRQPGRGSAWARKKQEEGLRAKLQQLAEQPLRHERAETFRRRLLGKEQKLFFTFLRHPQVPPTNNLAEQALRPVVLMRRIIQGTRSEKGLSNHSILRSLFETGRRQGKKLRQFFETLFTADTPTAQAALYRHPP
jgi:transposase